MITSSPRKKLSFVCCLIAGNTRDKEFRTVPSTIIESQLNYITAVKLEIETKFSNLIWINIAFHMHYTPAFDSWVKGLRTRANLQAKPSA